MICLNWKLQIRIRSVLPDKNDVQGARKMSSQNTTLDFLARIALARLTPNPNLQLHHTLNMIFHLWIPSLTLSLPAQKLSDLRDVISSFRGQKRATKRQLQQLVGRLNWACKVVYGGRTFLRRILWTPCQNLLHSVAGHSTFTGPWLGGASSERHLMVSAISLVKDQLLPYKQMREFFQGD